MASRIQPPDHYCHHYLDAQGEPQHFHMRARPDRDSPRDLDALDIPDFLTRKPAAIEPRGAMPWRRIVATMVVLLAGALLFAAFR